VTSPIAESGRRLTEDEARRLAVWRAIVKTSLALTWICLAIELGLLLWPRSPRALRFVTGIVLVESFLTAVVLGALGKCPACRASFGWESGRLMPESCRSCGVALETGRVPRSDRSR
jgi:hypothetical protein